MNILAGEPAAPPSTLIFPTETLAPSLPVAGAFLVLTLPELREKSLFRLVLIVFFKFANSGAKPAPPCESGGKLAETVVPAPKAFAAVLKL